MGPILIAINHGDAFLRGDISLPRFGRMLLTILVPYSVSAENVYGQAHHLTRL